MSKDNNIRDILSMPLEDFAEYLRQARHELFYFEPAPAARGNRSTLSQQIKAHRAKKKRIAQRLLSSN